MVQFFSQAKVGILFSKYYAFALYFEKEQRAKSKEQRAKKKEENLKPETLNLKQNF